MPAWRSTARSSPAAVRVSPLARSPLRCTLSAIRVLQSMTGRGPNGAYRGTPRSKRAQRGDRPRRYDYLSRNAEASGWATVPGAAGDAGADAGRGLHGLVLPLSL